jgi:hypothetical protein
VIIINLPLPLDLEMKTLIKDIMPEKFLQIDNNFFLRWLEAVQAHHVYTGLLP